MRALIVAALLAAAPAHAVAVDKSWLETNPVGLYADILVLLHKCEAASPSFLAAALRNHLPSYGYDEKDISEHVDAALKEHFMLSDKRACDMAWERYGPNGTVLEGAVEEE